MCDENEKEKKKSSRRNYAYHYAYAYPSHMIQALVIRSLGHLTFWDPRDCSLLGFPGCHYLTEFAETHVHCVDDVIQPSHPLLSSFCPQSLWTWGSFPMCWLLASGGQSNGASALDSVLPVNTQDWSPLEWTDWMCINIHKRRFIIRIGACSYGVKKLMRKPTINHFKLGKKGKVQNKFWKSHITPLHWQ